MSNLNTLPSVVALVESKYFTSPELYKNTIFSFLFTHLHPARLILVNVVRRRITNYLGRTCILLRIVHSGTTLL